METKVGTRLRVSTALMGIICGSAAAAQLPSNNGGDLPSPRIQPATCKEVTWSHDLISLYPQIGEACQEVLLSEGRKWARFQADFVRLDRHGHVTLDFKDRQNRQLERITLRPAVTQGWAIDGRVYSLTQLMRGQVLNVYLPEESFAASVHLGVPFDQLEEIVLNPFASR